MELNDLKGALSDFATADALQDDALTRQNLALALILNNQKAKAGEVLRRIAPPATADDEVEVVRSGKIAKCVYLIGALSEL